MNDYLLSVILGIVEGLTEFLPVSSTAHLRICERLLGVSLQSEYWKTYSVVIQLGAILSVVVYFRRAIRRFAATFPQGERGDRTFYNHPLTLTLVAFVMTAIPALLLERRIGETLESLSIMAWALVVGGVVMWIVDAIFSGMARVGSIEQMGLLRAIWIGAVQFLSAIFPGTSRSMATIAAGQTAGMSRSAALEFSFFLAIPTMLAATGLKLFKAIIADGQAGPRMDAQRWIVLGIGFVISFLVALAVVAWFMHWVRRRGFVPFAIYRIALGVAILAYLRYAPASAPAAPTTAPSPAPAQVVFQS